MHLIPVVWQNVIPVMTMVDDGLCLELCVVNGCVCPNGTIINEKTNECVAPDECPGDHLPFCLTINMCHVEFLSIIVASNVLCRLMSNWMSNQELVFKLMYKHLVSLMIILQLQLTDIPSDFVHLMVLYILHSLST